MERITDFVTDYIQREYTLPADTDLMALNYVDTGYVDSLGFVQFIALIEDEFGIQFSDDEIESDDIKVVGRLITMVEAHLAG